MVQVKSVRQKGKQPPSYVFLVKKHFSLDAYRAVVLVVFPQDADHPELYLVPADAWRTPNAPLVDRDYEGRKSRLRDQAVKPVARAAVPVDYARPATGAGGTLERR